MESTIAQPQTPVQETVDVMIDDTPTSARSMMPPSVDVRQPGPRVRKASPIDS